MKINNNISAVVSNKHLLRNENSLSISMEKLSSGFKINHAGDDPAGMAISAKMRAQIRGLDQASQNASDGTSVLETADGALNEVTAMIQRMRELSVQSANGTNSLSDRKSIQEEISDLTEEIQRISDSTEFNTKKLLDGSLDKRVYTDEISHVNISNSVPAGIYSFVIEEMPTRAELTSTSSWQDLETAMATVDEAYINVNGTGALLTRGMSAETIYEIVRQTAELGEATVSDFEDGTGTFNISSISYGTEASLQVQMDDSLAAALGITMVSIYANDTDPNPISVADITPGTNAKISLLKNNSDFGNQATIRTVTKVSSASASKSVDGRRLKITDVDGFEIDFLIDKDTIEDYAEKKEADPTYTKTVNLEVRDLGPMNLQIGANENQQMQVRINSIGIEKMYLEEVDVSTERGATRALEQLDEALAYISSTRSSLGAYTNRLEHAINSLDQTSENMNQAISRIQDADMATEMTEYTKFNVLQQASTSALSQANELPQTALQLLQ